MGDLSKNFSRKEFACQGRHCCGYSAPVHPDLIAGLQQLRDIAGPLKINSGFRCRRHNADIGGADESYHCLGMAADIAIPRGMTADGLAKLVESVEIFRNGGIGIYSSWLHVDCRGHKVRWQG